MSGLRSISSCSFVALAFALAACGSSGGMDPSGDDDPMTPDAPMTAQLDPADCTPFAQSIVAAAGTCGTPLPGNAQATFEGFCKKGIMAAELCGGSPAAGLECFATPDATDWVCLGAEPYPACNGDLAAALGMYCLVALGNPSCATGVQCDFDADCSQGLSCNEATGQCFDTQAYCVGLPCEFDADCPGGHTCNDAEGMCIAE